MGIILDVKNLTKKIVGLTAVNDMSFEINRGEFVGLIGPNGAGKTTIFNMISGFEKPSSGTIDKYLIIWSSCFGIDNIKNVNT